MNHTLVDMFKLFLSMMVDLLFFSVKINLNLSMSLHVTNTLNRVRSMNTIMPEHLTKDPRKPENNKNPILNDTEIVNLGVDDSVTKTRVIIHLATT